MPERDAELADRGVGRAGHREVGLGQPVEHRRRRSGRRSGPCRRRPSAAPARTTGSRTPLSVSDGEPDQRGGLQDQPGDQERAQPGAAGEQPGDRGDDHRRRGPGQGAQAGLERACSPARSGGTAPAGRPCRTCPSVKVSPITLATENPREAKSRSGSTAWARPRDQSEVRRDEHRGGDQASRGPRPSSSRRRCRARCPRCRGRPRRRAGRRRRGRAAARCHATRAPRAAAAGARRRATGTLSQKIACQLTPSTTAPPMTGPSATPRPETPPQMPIAAARICRRDRGGEQGQRQRHDRGRAQPLHGPRRDQRLRGGAQRGGDGGEGEDA